MAKQKRRAEVRKGQTGHSFEESFDDSLLPDASEIQKLHQIDPDIMDWLKARAAREQEFRHESFDKKVHLVNKTERGIRWINYLGLFFSFLLLSGGMFLSYYLISEDHEIIGSIFTGGMLLAIASLFLNKVQGNGSKVKKSN